MIKLSFCQANEDVTQMVEVLPPGPAKWTWLIKRLVEMTTCKLLSYRGQLLEINDVVS